MSGGYVSQSDGTAYVCPRCVFQELALGQPTGILPLAAGVAAETASQKAREHSGASPARRTFKGSHGLMFAEMLGTGKRGWESCTSPGNEIQGDRLDGQGWEGGTRCPRRGRGRGQHGRSARSVPVPAGLCVAGLGDLEVPRTHMPFVTCRREAASPDEMRTNRQKL